MSKILIENEGFLMASALTDLVANRSLPVETQSDVTAKVEPIKGATLVFSSTYEAQVGGAKALIEKARKFLPRLVMIVNETADAFGVTEELGGKIIRLALPAAPEEGRTGVLMVADLVCAELSSMIAVDKASLPLLSLAARVARSDVTAFINGPTGTGKEVLARFIHTNSPRDGQPFVAINCAAIPEDMLEAMLFGHEKGSFTGASVANKGIFRAANGGTLLLDEISEMPIGLQSKLLRVLQERTVTPIGSQAEVPVDVRVVATSNRDMMAEVQANNFREDLYYRLNVFPLATQSLADRPDDIIPLAIALIRRHSDNLTTMPWLTAEAAKMIRAHDWPGNVRELENVVQRALVLHMDGRITANDIILDQPNQRNMAMQVQQRRMMPGLAG